MEIRKDIFASYSNGDYHVTILTDGTKIRTGHGESVFPESMDVKITDYCDGNCKWCHEQSSIYGVHAYLPPTIKLIKQLPRGTEIAIGGGDPFSHPHFTNFVKELSQHGIICNVTINEKHFKRYLPRLENLIDNGYIHGVGYSYRHIPCEWKYEHLVNHVIVGITEQHELPRICRYNKKLLLLGYKSKGRGILYHHSNFDKVNNNTALWYRVLPNILEEYHVSFDNLAIKQLNPKRLFLNENDYNKYYMGDDGTFTMFLDAVEQKYTVSSTCYSRFSYKENITDMFSHIKELA